MRVGELIEVLKTFDPEREIEVGLAVEGEQELRLYEVVEIGEIEIEPEDHAVAIIVDVSDEDDFAYDDEA